MQDKVYEEILNIFGTENPENNPIKLEDLQHLKYLERVIKETMRLFPTTPIITRHVSQDLELGIDYIHFVLLEKLNMKPKTSNCVKSISIFETN